MHDEAEVGLVEAHTECRGRDEGLDLVGAQGILEAFAVRGVGATGVGRHPMVGPREGVGDILGTADGQRIHDAAPRQVAKVREQPAQPLLRRHRAQHSEPQRVPGQTAPDRRDRRAPRRQLHFDIGNDPRIRRRGRREDGRVGRETVEQVLDPAIVRPEVVPPVADAVGLVHDEQPAPARQVGQLLLAEARIVQALGRDEQHVDLVGRQRIAHLIPVGGVG